MAVSKSLATVLTVILVVGGGAAATGFAQTDEDTSTADSSNLEMDATLDNGTVVVTVMNDGSPVENASLTVEGEQEVRVTTDTDGAATVDSTVLAEDNESLEELEIEYESDHVEGELEFVVQDGSLTLVEAEYEVEEEDEEEDEEDDEEDDEEREEDEEDDDEDDEEREEESSDDEGDTDDD